MNKQLTEKIYDVVIVGVGPAGLSSALAAKKAGLKSIIIDKGNIVNSIINFPKNMIFFSTTDNLELNNIPFTSEFFRPNRNEAIRYYQRIVLSNNLQFRLDSEVINIKKSDNSFEIEYLNNKKKSILISKYIIIATGFYDNPNMLNIPGENFDHVSHYYNEPFNYYGKKVVVVGGKNSAIEAALDLFRSGIDVTLIHRKKEIKESVKYWILPDLTNRIKSGEIKVLLNSELNQINMDSVIVKKNNAEIVIPADAVLLLTGYFPKNDLLKKIKINVDKNTLIPEINNNSLESNVKGIYLAGSLIAGRNSNKIFIENSRGHGEKIINNILNMN